jgi:hypothetical protein
MTNAYKQVFDTTHGRAVLRDLERIANTTKINADDPNSLSAIWKCAQQALIQRIYNQLEQTHDGR